MKTHLSIEKTPNVLIFDSGVGGLSVYDEISRLLPNVNYIYVFDNAAFPYGEKSESFIIERDLKLIEMIEQEYAIDLAVIACNTASTVVLPALRAKFKFPIVGVVPAIKPAVALTKNSVVGLLATKGTVMRSYTHDLIKQFATNCKVELLGSSRLVEIAEDKLHGKPIEIDEVKAIFSPWLQLKAKPDTIILGCTHFPLLMEELKIALPEKTQFVDSGAAIARRVAALISSSAHKNDVIDNSNITICTQLDKKVIALRPALKRYRLGNLCEYRL